MSDEWLFAGELVNDRLSNEVAWLQHCTPEFRDPDNPWTASAFFIFCDMNQYDGTDDSNRADWKWRQDSKISKLRKLECFNNFLHSTNSGLRASERAAVLGCMLSKMLADYPSKSALAL